MAYRLSIADDVPSSVRTCAREQLAGAVERLERAEEDPVKAVHEARKHLKKTRALLRLVRPALGTRAYRRENDALRDAGLALSGTRDADVLVATADKLAEHAAGRLPADVFDAAARRARGGGRGRAGAADDEPIPALADVIEALRAAELRVEAMAAGRRRLGHAARRRRRARTRAGATRSPSRAPRPSPSCCTPGASARRTSGTTSGCWRPPGPTLLGAQAEEAHALTELLGDDHDLAVLAAAPRRRRSAAAAGGRRRARRAARARRRTAARSCAPPPRGSAAASTPSRRRPSRAASRATSTGGRGAAPGRAGMRPVWLAAAVAAGGLPGLAPAPARAADARRRRARGVGGRRLRPRPVRAARPRQAAAGRRLDARRVDLPARRRALLPRERRVRRPADPGGDGDRRRRLRRRPGRDRRRSC